MVIWLASFPKSGTTWFRMLLANLVADQTGPADINDLPDQFCKVASSRRIFERETMLDSTLLSHDEIDCLRPRIYEGMAKETGEPCWIKTDDAYTMTLDGEPLLGRVPAGVVLYIVRDPRDVAVSMASQMNVSVDEAIALLNDPGGTLAQGRFAMHIQLRQKLTGWSRHVTGWLGQTDMPVHVLRYEDLSADTAGNFARALQFVGHCELREDIVRAVRQSDFCELKRQEEVNGFAERFPHGAPFFRSGKVGGWRRTLTAKQVATITNCHGEVMRRLGYEL
jgi:aryl sulfotransferase